MWATRTRCSATRVRRRAFSRVAPRLTLAADGFASGETVFEQRAADRKRKVTTLLAGAATEEDAVRVRASRCRLGLVSLTPASPFRASGRRRRSAAKSRCSRTTSSPRSKRLT
jgi:hypothetical protein